MSEPAPVSLADKLTSSLVAVALACVLGVPIWMLAQSLSRGQSAAAGSVELATFAGTIATGNQSGDASQTGSGTGDEAADADEFASRLQNVSAAVTAALPTIDGPQLAAYLAPPPEDAPVEVARREIPRAQRWQIFFPEGNTLQDYAEQLDKFGIELGVITGPNQVEYASRLAANVPDKRDGRADEEQRLYMSWGRSDLADADRELAAKADIDSAGKVVLHFYPDQLEAKLTELEQAFAGREEAEILWTRFGIRKDGQYELYVIDQMPLK